VEGESDILGVLSNRCEGETQACSSKEVLTSLFIIFLQRSWVRTSLPISGSLQAIFGVSIDFTCSEVLGFRPLRKPFHFESRFSAAP
jgi:hypothetical protein